MQAAQKKGMAAALIDPAEGAAENWMPSGAPSASQGRQGLG